VSLKILKHGICFSLMMFTIFFSFIYSKTHFAYKKHMSCLFLEKKKLSGIKANSLWIWHDDKQKDGH